MDVVVVSDPVCMQTPGSSCGSVCLGLTITFVLAFVAVVAAVVFLAWKRGYLPENLPPVSLPTFLQSKLTSPSENIRCSENQPNTTVIQVNNDNPYDNDFGYDRPESFFPQSECDPDYLHLPKPEM